MIVENLPRCRLLLHNRSDVGHCPQLDFRAAASSERFGMLGSMAKQQSWTPAQQNARATLVSRNEFLKDEVARIAAAAAIPLAVVPSLHDVDDSAAEHIVLMDAETARERRRGTGPTILVGTDEPGVDLWDLGARISAHHVALLPHAAAWLVECFSRATAAGSSGHSVGVLSAAGGAGASSLSCWLAQASVAAGYATLLVDGDQWGAGLELPLGAERVPGVRWQDVREVRGTVTPGQLAGSLPASGGFNLLSWRRTEPGDLTVFPDAEAVTAVMDAGRQGHDLTVVDLGRLGAVDESLLAQCQSFVVLVPAQVRAVVAARQLVAALAPMVPTAVVRGPLTPEMGERMIAESLKLPLAGYLPGIRGVRGAADSGRILTVGHHRAVRRVVGRIIAELSLHLGEGQGR